MREIYDNIFHEVITYQEHHLSPRNLYLIRQPERSLMVDTSVRFERDWNVIQGMIEELGIDYKKLDVFITHNHPDHTGLILELQEKGARVLMNPTEVKERADFMHSYLCNMEIRVANLRLMGVMEEGTPEVYRAFMEYTDRAYLERKEPVSFDFVPIHPGDVLEYGEYRFEVILLRGHTAGQCGLLEPEKRLLFCGDQIMTQIVPIVVSQQTDIRLLRSYLESLKEIAGKYGDCQFLSSHYDAIEDPQQEAQRIISSYRKTCGRMLEILRENGQWMTSRDIGVRAYGRSQGPPDYDHFAACTYIWAKTFSCMELMHEEGVAMRREEDGIVYWKAV